MGRKFRKCGDWCKLPSMNASCAALIALLATGAWGQQDSPSGAPLFRANSDLVLLDVQVIDKKTHTAAGKLGVKDFELTEDGTPQKILFVGRDQLPLSLVLLFDLTESDRGVLHRLAAGAQSALDHLKAEDEVAVMVYAAGARLIDGFTRDHARTAAAIAKAGSMKSNDAAFFNEAVYQAAAQLEYSTNPSSRRIVLWFTDNYPNLPTKEMLRKYAKGLDGEMPHTEEEAIRKLHESGTVVMPLLLKDRLFFLGGLAVAHDRGEFARENPGKEYPPGDANKYAELTGGFAIGLRGKGADESLAEAIDDLRTLYTISYHPAEEKAPGQFCRVHVALAPGAPLRPQEWRVLAREGYYRR
jgi:VWFA-related protein